MIILLNGCSSAGKSSIAKAVQHLSSVPWLHLGIDSFINMTAPQYTGFGNKANEGFCFTAAHDSNGPLVHVESGPYKKSVSQSIPKVVQTLADDGHHLIVDEVIF